MAPVRIGESHYLFHPAWREASMLILLYRSCRLDRLLPAATTNRKSPRPIRSTPNEKCSLTVLFAISRGLLAKIDRYFYNLSERCDRLRLRQTPKPLSSSYWAAHLLCDAIARKNARPKLDNFRLSSPGTRNSSNWEHFVLYIS